MEPDSGVLVNDLLDDGGHDSQEIDEPQDVHEEVPNKHVRQIRKYVKKEACDKVFNVFI